MMSRTLDQLRLLPAATAALFLLGLAGARAELVISEFVAANSSGLVDEDGAYSDWLEIHNPDPTSVTLAGWYLTDSASNKTKWQLPAVTVPSGGFLVVFASNKNRVDADSPLHTNFALSAAGEYLALVKPDGVTVAHEYAPSFPAQPNDVAYGLPMASEGVLRSATFLPPTPGAANAGHSASVVTETVSFSTPSGPFRNAFTLQLAGAGAGQQVRYVATSGSQAAPVELTANAEVYTRPLTIDRSTTIRAAVFAANGSRGPVSTAHFTRVGGDIATFSSQLPVLVLDTLGIGPLVKDAVDHPSWSYLYDTGRAGPPFTGAPALISPLEATVRGSSSSEFPKKGYNIKFTDELGNGETPALLDLPAFEKWALVAPWSYDRGYINNAFAYSLSNQMGRWAPRTRLVELFLNADGGDLERSDYAGIYVLTDRVEIDQERLNLESLSSSDLSGEALTGGYVLKLDPPDEDEIGWATLRGIPGDGVSTIVLVSPKAEDVRPEQLTYIQTYVQRMEDALHADRATGWAQRTYLDYVDRDSWVDHHLINTFLANPDGLIRSAYFHKDRGGRLAAGPVWDFDRAIGSYADSRSWRWDVWHGVGAPDYWKVGWWGIIAEDPEFMQDWVDRWQSLRRAELSASNLRRLVESLAAQVGSDAAGRDAARWPDNVSPYGSYAATIERMRNWLIDRAQWIDDQFVAPPVVTVSGGTLTFNAAAGTQLVYTTDGSDPRSLGGDIAANAKITSASLTVNASANVHVRSYRPELRSAVPGTPWSSAVGGENSSPLTPKARLVNLSSRAVVGTGENALIAGVVVADTEGKRYLSRAIGPSLSAFGANGYVPDPQLSIYSGSGTELFRNNGWETAPQATQLPDYSRRVGAFPLASGSRDSALTTDISAGAYTLQVSTPTGQNGIGLAELYEMDANGRTINLSTRAQVRSDEGVLIGGFVVSGPAYKRMLIRAVGPTLSGFGVSAALTDPMLTLRSGTTVVASNDRWDADPEANVVAAASKRVGAFALAAGSEDAALLITLPPGAYTVEVKGKAGAEGVALLEIYDVP